MIPIHPRIVHFPVAFLIGAALFGILALIFKNKRNVFKEVLFWNLAIGVPASVIAIISGLLEEGSLIHNDTIHSIMEIHKLFGYIFSGIFLVLLIWLILRKSKMNNMEFTGMVVVLVLSAGLLGYSSHLGGTMVYEHGAGVIPMEEIFSNEEFNHTHDGETGHYEEHAEADTMKNATEPYHDHNTHEHDETEHK